METLLQDIISELKDTDCPDERFLDRIIHRHNRKLTNNQQHFSKKKLLPYYLKVKEQNPGLWTSWSVDPALEKLLFKILQMKPRRTASGVATITVITKPWKCSSDCLYCPNDVRMPKSYLSDEPACQRAERNYFDPYLQVASRLRALTQMGHVTDKIELIVLGGTWSDYPCAYQIWFVEELFRALNDGGDSTEQACRIRRKRYKDQGLSTREADLQQFTAVVQQQVNAGVLTYNQAIEQLYGENSNWRTVAAWQVSDMERLTAQQTINETARHRVVGLAIETRPDAIDAASLTLLRQLGCTKIQMGIQSLDPQILAQNARRISIDTIDTAFELLRVFGFKIHTHFMLNLLGATPRGDKQDFQTLVSALPYQPDEIKLYPCALVTGTKLCQHYANQTWRPYTETELLDVLIADALSTPAFTRISRMIRDISADDIVVGNKKANLRQLVEARIKAADQELVEIRHREISTSETAIDELELKTVAYQTSATDELFLQWVTPKNQIAGFLRLSLPHQDYVQRHLKDLAISTGEAMIREVHVYGKVAGVHQTSESAQHLGLGKQLIQAACSIALARGHSKLNVISSVGTREYYRALGFYDQGLYQQIALV